MSNDQLHNTAGANLSVGDVSLDVAGVASLTPAISSISGALTEDSTITIIGSGFSANRQGQLYYDDFSTGALGTNVSSLDDNHSYKYVDDDAYTGTRSALWHHPAGDDSLIHPRVELPDGVTDVFVCHAQKIIEIDDGSGSEGDGTQIKLTRIVAGQSGTEHSTNPNFRTTVQIANSWMSTGITNKNSDSIVYTHDNVVMGEWQTYIAQFKLGDEGVANGIAMLKAYGDDSAGLGAWNLPAGGHLGDVTGEVPPKSWNMPANRVTMDTNPEYRQLKKVFVPFFMRARQDYKIYIDSLFINDSREAVIIADNQDLEQATLNKIIALPMSSRSTNSITAEMKKGQLAGSNAFLFAFNADGSYNKVGYDLGVL